MKKKKKVKIAAVVENGQRSPQFLDALVIIVLYPPNWIPRTIVRVQKWKYTVDIKINLETFLFFAPYVEDGRWGDVNYI